MNPYQNSEPDHCMHVVNFYDIRKMLLVGRAYWMLVNGIRPDPSVPNGKL